MNEDVDDRKSSDASSSILLDSGISNESNKLSKEKAIILGATCLSIVRNDKIFYIYVNIFF
jgi:hypothetical protein